MKEDDDIPDEEVHIRGVAAVGHVGAGVDRPTSSSADLRIHSCRRSQSIDSGFVTDLDCIYENKVAENDDPSSVKQAGGPTTVQNMPTGVRGFLFRRFSHGFFSAAPPAAVTNVEQPASKLPSVDSDVTVSPSTIDDDVGGETDSADFVVHTCDVASIASVVTSLDSFDSNLSLQEPETSDAHLSRCPACPRTKLLVVDETSFLVARLSSEIGQKKSVCFTDQEPQDKERLNDEDSSKQSWLLRLFQSKLFDISIALHYLFNSKEHGVQTYIGT